MKNYSAGAVCFCTGSPSKIGNHLRNESTFPCVEPSFHELTEKPKQTAAFAAGEIRVASCRDFTSDVLAASEGLDIKIIRGACA